MFITTLSSPVGQLFLASDGRALTGLWLEKQKYFAWTLPTDTTVRPDIPVFKEATLWLDTYFSGAADLPALPPMSPKGSNFQRVVWEQLLMIPLGQTTTYGHIAQALRQQGISASAQAVGGAVGHNPISILIPCHRVVGADGSLTGYAGGVEKKRFLLEHEQKSVMTKTETTS